MTHSSPNGVPVRSNYYDVTIFSKELGVPAPQEITELETFSLATDFISTAALPIPAVDLYHTGLLIGVLLKGITG